MVIWWVLMFADIPDWRAGNCRIIHPASPIITSHIVNMEKYVLTRQMESELGMCFLSELFSSNWSSIERDVSYPGLVPGRKVNNLWNVVSEVTNVAKYNTPTIIAIVTQTILANTWTGACNARARDQTIKIFAISNFKNLCCRSQCGSCCRRTWVGSAVWRGPWSPAGPSSPGWRWTTGETGETNVL